MKKLLFISFILMTGLGIQLHANQNHREVFVCQSDNSEPKIYLPPVTYDMNLPEFSYSITLPLYQGEKILFFNFPIAQHLFVGEDTGRIEFTIDKETFEFQIYRKFKDQGYFDLQIPVYYQYKDEDINYPYLSRIFVLRILWKNND